MRSVGYILSLLLGGLTLYMLIPALVTTNAALPFVVSAAITGSTAAILFLASRSVAVHIDRRKAFLLTTGAWVALSLFSALPMALLGLSVTDAAFEAVSGLTTTGSTVITGLDTQPRALLLWRALLQWFGGVGIVVTSIALLPFLNIGGMQLFRTESSDRSEKELPRASALAGATLWVYASLSMGCALAYALTGMSDFDAITHAMATVSTGGFSTHDASMGYFANPVTHWVGAVFMLASAIPLVLYIRVFRTGHYRSTQSVTLFRVLLGTIIILTVWLLQHGTMTLFQGITLVSFNVISIVTTTGFVTTDYTQWGSFAVIGFFFLTFLGGCTGSTTGGLKMMRLIVASKVVVIQLRRVVYPHGIFNERYEDKPLSHDIISSVLMFILLFLMSWLALSFLLILCGLDLETSMSGSATALANVGPGIGKIIGPAGTFASLPDIAKWFLCVGMLLGRLELLTVLVLFTRAYWDG